MRQRKLLELLSDGQFHSGEDLAKILGMSRTGVWKHIKSLESLGVEIYSVRGRGYRVPGGLDLIDQKSLMCELDRLPLQGVFEQRELYLQTGSTNELALQALRKGVNKGLYIAEQQTAGRGRRGRQWISPFASGIYFSIAWRFRCGVNELDGLSLVVGLAVKRVLDKMGIQQVEVKWPNDLLVQGRKLAGVLIEVQGDTSIESQLVIGVGVNTGLAEQHASAITQPWVDIKQQRVELSRTQLLIDILLELVTMLDLFEKQGFAYFQREWMAADHFKGQAVQVQTGADSFITGIAQGVNTLGALQLETNEGMRTLHGGEVSLRRLSE